VKALVAPADQKQRFEAKTVCIARERKLRTRLETDRPGALVVIVDVVEQADFYCEPHVVRRRILELQAAIVGALDAVCPFEIELEVTRHALIELDIGDHPAPSALLLAHQPGLVVEREDAGLLEIEIARLEARSPARERRCRQRQRNRNARERYQFSKHSC